MTSKKNRDGGFIPKWLIWRGPSPRTQSLSSRRRARPGNAIARCTPRIDIRPVMVSRTSARSVVEGNDASIRSIVAGGNMVQYDTTKAAVAGLTRAMAQDQVEAMAALVLCDHALRQRATSSSGK